MICPNCKKEIDANSRFCMYCGAEFLEEKIPYVDIEPDDPTLKNIPQEKEPEPAAFRNEEEPAKDKNTKTLQIIIAAVVIVLLLGVLTAIGIKTDFFGLTGETVTDAEGEKIRSGRGTVEISVKDTDGQIRQIKSDRSLLSAEEILAEYTAVLNKLKTDSPAFSRVRYQNLPTENQNLGAIGNLVLPIIEETVTSKAAADKVSYKTGNADKLPIANSQSGCLLTDSSKIKNAYCEILENGDYKLVITLCDELNPKALSAGAQTTDGVINSMFEPYSAAEKITAVAQLAMSSIDFNYTDCTATLVYDNKTQQVKSINLTQNIDITADAYITQFKARIVDITDYSDFVY